LFRTLSGATWRYLPPNTKTLLAAQRPGKSSRPSLYLVATAFKSIQMPVNIVYLFCQINPIYMLIDELEAQ
jgi:hypothetical protein